MSFFSKHDKCYPGSAVCSEDESSSVALEKSDEDTFYSERLMDLVYSPEERPQLFSYVVRAAPAQVLDN